MGIPPGIRLESAKTPCLYGALIMCHHSYDYEFPIVCRERLTNNLSVGKHHLNAMEEFFYRVPQPCQALNLVIFGIGFTSSFEEEVNYVVQVNTWTEYVCIKNFRVSNLLDTFSLILGKYRLFEV